MKRILSMVLVTMMCVLAANVGFAAEGPAIVDFSYEQGEYPDAMYSFAVYQDEGVTWFSAMSGDGVELNINTRVDDAVFEEIAALVEQYKLQDWHGFSEIGEEEAPGHRFSLSVLFDEEGEIFAEGQKKYPANYEEANKAIMKFFMDKSVELEEAGLDDEEDIDLEGMEAY